MLGLLSATDNNPVTLLAAAIRSSISLDDFDVFDFVFGKTSSSFCCKDLNAAAIIGPKQQ